ncbi:MAG: DUF1015 domain-containing protein [Monoglobales bacterium]
MNRILPFRALRYNKNVVGNLSAVLAPPYDTITKEQQKKLYDSHPFNVVRLEYGMANETDSDIDNRYTRSAETLNEWLHSGVFVRDRQPAIYVYGQEFILEDGRKQSCNGLVCLVRIEDSENGLILPHQETLPNAKNDRFNLMTACGANFSAIFSLYSDEKNIVSSLISDTVSGTPEVSVKIDGLNQNLWPITDTEIIDNISSVLEDKQFFIADGHHRYETAVNYRNIMRLQNPDHTGDEPYNYVMMFIVNMDDPCLAIFPTHRLVKNIVGFNEQGIISQLSESFDVEKFEIDETSVSGKLRDNTSLPSFAMYTGKDYYYLLKLKDISLADAANPDKSVALRHLDVTVLHSVVLEKVFGLTEAELKKQTYLCYTRSISEAVELVKDGKFQRSFMLSPAKIHEIKAIALANEKMPQKSTYFCPEPITGFVMNKIN